MITYIINRIDFGSWFAHEALTGCGCAGKYGTLAYKEAEVSTDCCSWHHPDQGYLAYDKATFAKDFCRKACPGQLSGAIFLDA